MKRLFTNATFVTMVDDVDTADALLVDDDGRIAYIGDAEEARRLAHSVMLFAPCVVARLRLIALRFSSQLL